MKIKIYILLVCAALVTSNGCADLEVVNPNNPDTERVLSTSDDYKGVVAGAYVSLYAMYNAYFCNVHMEWTGDYLTMTNNFRQLWSQFKREPRPQFNNTLAFTDLDIIGTPFKRLHSTISSTNDVIRAIEVEGKKVGADGVDNNMVLAAAYFAKGMALGYLANTFDQAYVVGPSDDVAKATLVDYKKVLEASLASFDKVIALSTSGTFTLDKRFINTPAPYDNVKLARLARTYAANFMVQNARNATENAETNWDKVLGYTENGMVDDYIITLDGTNWTNGLQTIAGLNWYWRVDHRIIRLMDPTYPKRFPADASVTSYPKATSVDKRLDLYYFYEPGLSFFRSDRGLQLRSHYRFKSYDDLLQTGLGPSTFLYAYTNVLLRAEALAMKDRLPEAVVLLNAGKRTTVGELPALVATTKEAVLEAVFYERDVDLRLTDFGLHFKDMRRRNALQKGTILHFPVPADELATIGVRLYSYGGEANADGKNTADGSASWK